MVWKDKNTPSVVVLRDGIIYKGESEEQSSSDLLDLPEVDVEDFSSLPLSYITRVEMWKGQHSIEIYYKEDVSFDIEMKDKATLKSIFDKLRQECTNLNYTKGRVSLSDLSKASLFAILAITCIYIVSLFMKPSGIFSLSSGMTKTDGIVAIFYALNSLGITKLTFAFLGTLLFPALNIIRISRRQRIVETLE